MSRTGDGQLRALLVEDLSTQRVRLVSALQADGDIAVDCLSTSDDAVERVEATRPDVVILDLSSTDGHPTHTIEQIMAHIPTPILVLSTRIHDRQSPSAVDALVAGALDALPRPDQWSAELGVELRRAVRQLSKVPVIRHPRGNRGSAPRRPGVRTPAEQPVIAVAASTGGPSALATLLPGLAGLNAPVLVVQHLHPDFTRGLVEWMSRVSALPVRTAVHQELARPGQVYFAPGGRHLRYAPSGRLQLSESPKTAHTPSADELFVSIAESAGRSAIGVLLTGMGEDGALGLLEIRRRGGRTLAQDEASSTVFGMPRAAARLGAVSELLPIEKMADAIQRAVRELTLT
ncbi:chemotaxis protein CheB [Microlunatus sp. Gsoil 973]|jgi:two-component system chemotaxis response regulator CheB|uniref:chemotaxis protein CheB n=1 Tax=Microlunatus sp. Gsoil 973 TaxID=2672569 RepID=UPI0012B4973A|nr:chemotaxis protein CheB [Microlunatus sp. Gsoil 973]QGN34373.1 response regulator [Microlunatus sp. Gsoil 973]